jgi:hypothetical protein
MTLCVAPEAALLPKISANIQNAFVIACAIAGRTIAPEQ